MGKADQDAGKLISMSVIVWLAVVAMAGLMVAGGLGVNLELGPEIMLAFGILLDAYVGSDQFAAVMKTKKLPSGARHAANRRKLTLIVLAAFALTVEAVLIQILMAGSSGGLSLPAMPMFLIFLTAAALLTAGEKVKTAVEDDGPGWEGSKK